MKRLISLAFAVLLTASTLSAGQLHSDDPKYRGAFTILTAGLVQGARAAYWTDMKILNDSDHAIAKLRFELYSTNGEYKEWIDDVNPLQAFPDALGAYGYGWGMIMAAGDPTGETPVLVPGGWLAQELGMDMGTLRVVALNADGSDDMTAVLGGSARIWTMPNSGGRMWMDQPGLSDYELIAKDLRIARNYRSNPEDVVRLRVFTPVRMYIYGEDSTTELVGLVNFDRTRSITFTLGGRNETGPGSRHCELPQIQVEVPPGQSRRVPIDHCPGPFAGGGTIVSVPVGTTAPWTAYEQYVSNVTGAAHMSYDWITEILLLRRAH